MKPPESLESARKTPELPRFLKKLSTLSERDSFDFFYKHRNEIEKEVRGQSTISPDIGNKFLENPYGYIIIRTEPSRFSGLNHEKLLYAVGKYFFATQSSNLEDTLSSIEKLGVSRPETALALLRSGELAGATEYLIKNIKSFAGLDLKVLADELFANDNGHHVEYYWDTFSEAINPQELYERLIKDAVESSDKQFFFLHAADFLQKVSSIDPNSLVKALIQTGRLDVIKEKPRSFYTLDQQAFAELVVAAPREVYFMLLNNIDKFKKVADESAIAKAILEKREDGASDLSDILHCFKNLNGELAIRLLQDKENANAFEVVRNVKSFSNPDYKKIYTVGTEMGFGPFVVDTIDAERTEGIDESVVRLLYEDWNKFRKGEKLNDGWAIGGVAKLRSLQEYASERFSITLDKYLVALDTLFSPEVISYRLYSAFASSCEIRGVEATKRDFEQKSKEAREICLNPNASPEELRSLLTEPYRTFALLHTRFDSSQWGSHGAESFDQIIQSLAQSSKDRNDSPEMGVSGKITVERVKQLERPKKTVDGFPERYRSLIEDIQWAVDKSRSSPIGGFRELIEEVRTLLQTHEKQLRERMGVEKNEKAIVNLEQRLKLIEAVERGGSKQQPRFGHSLESRTERIVPLLKSLIQLSKGKLGSTEHQIVRRAAFLVSALNNRISASEVSNINSDPNTASLESISRIVEFIQHVTFQETFSGGGGRPAMLADESLKDLERVLGSGVLQEQLAQFEGGVSRDTSTFEIVQTRGLGLELSGHMGDACWASRYELISKEFPHISALNFVLEPGTKNERTAGACLLMKATVNGKSVYIIRGLNPIENVINKHDPSAFTREIVKYLESTVGQDAQIAIVIDDHAGGSSTNRPVLFSYLNKLKSNLKRVPLPKNNNLRFNDYDITDNTYLISSKNF